MATTNEFSTIAPPANGKIVAAVYAFEDKTGQRKPSDRLAHISTAVTQGAESLLLKALADVGDGQWDSGIFLEANSLSSETPISVTHTVSQQFYANPDWMAEGCVSATITLTREANLQTALTIPLVIAGTATNGVDYTTIPNSVTFNPGQATVIFSLDAIFDNVAEGSETINLAFQISDPCGNITPIGINLIIQDIEATQVNISNPYSKLL
jgi:hypothetical protein